MCVLENEVDCNIVDILETEVSNWWSKRSYVKFFNWAGKTETPGVSQLFIPQMRSTLLYFRGFSFIEHKNVFRLVR